MTIYMSCHLLNYTLEIFTKIENYVLLYFAFISYFHKHRYYLQHKVGLPLLPLLILNIPYFS